MILGGLQITGVGVVKLQQVPMEEDPWVPHQVRVELLKPQAAKHMVKFAEGSVKPGAAATGIKKTASEALYLQASSTHMPRSPCENFGTTLRCHCSPSAPDIHASVHTNLLSLLSPDN